MNFKRLKKWEKSRAKGKFRFVLLNGIIKFGFSTAILVLITRKFRHPTYDLSIQFVILLLIGHSIGGYIFGLWAWNRNEQEYLLRKDELTKSEDKLSNKG